MNFRRSIILVIALANTLALTPFIPVTSATETSSANQNSNSAGSGSSGSEKSSAGHASAASSPSTDAKAGAEGRISAFAKKLSPADKQTMTTVDEIIALPDGPSLPRNISPYLQNVASMLQMSPGDFRLHFLLARCYEKLGMEELASVTDKNAERIGEEKYRAFVLKALKKKIEDSEFDAALAYNVLAEKFFPDDASVLIAKAIQLHKDGKFDEEEKLLEGVGSAKKELGVSTALASIKILKGKYQDALTLFENDLAKDGKFQPALLGKAKALERMHRYGESLRIAIPLYLEDTLHYELAALVANGFCHLGYYWQAYEPNLVSLAVAMKKEQMDDAKRRLKFIWPRLSATQKKQGLDDVSQVLDKTVFGPRMHFAIGDALQQAGFPRDAEMQFREGLKWEPRHARAYLHIAEICQNDYHNNNSAIFNYVKYLHFNGPDTAIQKRLERLTQEKARYKDIALRIKTRMNKLNRF